MADRDSPIKKSGPRLRAPTETVAGLKVMGVDVANLSNNHILDHGEQGLKTTLEALRSREIRTVGVAMDLNSAKKPLIMEKCGVRVGIYACCEHEYSYATDTNGGANPIELFDSFEDVETLRENCDLLIVLYHGGREGFEYPMPFQRKVMRQFAKCGAYKNYYLGKV